MKRLFGLILGLVLAVGAMSAANAAVIRYITGVDHETNIATAATKLATSLGGSTATPFTGLDDVTWSGVMASANIIFIGQSAGLASLTATTRANLATWVNGGGVLIVLWDSESLTVVNGIMGASMTWTSPPCCDSVPIPKQSAAAGSTYDSSPATLPRLNDHGAIVASSIPATALNAYDLAGVSYVMSANVGAGSVSFLSWDWCCGDTTADRDAWDNALLSAATFSGFASPRAQASIPTLSEWGLIVMASLLALTALVALRRRG